MRNSIEVVTAAILFLFVISPFTVNAQPILELNRPGVGDIRALCVTPDAKKIVVHEFTRQGNTVVDRVVLVNVADGKIERILDEEKGASRTNRCLRMAADGNSVVMAPSTGSILARFDLRTGKIVKRFNGISGKRIDSRMLQYSGDGSKIAVPTSDSGAVVWDFETGKASFLELAFIPIGSMFVVFPLSGRNELLVMVAQPSNGDLLMQLVLFDPGLGKTNKVTEFMGNSDLRLSADGKSVCLFRQENPELVAWTAIEKWDLVTLKMACKIELKPQLASISFKLSQDGNTLFFHEYMQQRLVLWNLDLGKFGDIIPGEGWGCEAFDITPDGKKVVATVGPWVQGALSPRKLIVYDTSSFIGADSKP